MREWENALESALEKYPTARSKTLPGVMDSIVEAYNAEDYLALHVFGTLVGAVGYRQENRTPGGRPRLDVLEQIHFKPACGAAKATASIIQDIKRAYEKEPLKVLRDLGDDLSREGLKAHVEQREQFHLQTDSISTATSLNAFVARARAVIKAWARGSELATRPFAKDPSNNPAVV